MSVQTTVRYLHRHTLHLQFVLEAIKLSYTRRNYAQLVRSLPMKIQQPGERCSVHYIRNMTHNRRTNLLEFDARVNYLNLPIWLCHLNVDC